jgi:hypothetical protein
MSKPAEINERETGPGTGRNNVPSELFLDNGAGRQCFVVAVTFEENDYAENTLDWRNLDRNCSACSNSGFSQMVRTSEYIKHCAGY